MFSDLKTIKIIIAVFNKRSQLNFKLLCQVKDLTEFEEIGHVVIDGFKHVVVQST